MPGATPAPSSPERQAHWFSMTVTHMVTRGHSRNAFFCCLFVLGLPGKGEEDLGREGEGALSHGVSEQGDKRTGGQAGTAPSQSSACP